MRSIVASAILAGVFVLAPGGVGAQTPAPKRPFTVTDEPVSGTVVDTMVEKTCTGTVIPIWSWAGEKFLIKATWYRRPDGSKWVEFYRDGIGPSFFPVLELGVSARWRTPPKNFKGEWTTYSLWPGGGNRLTGRTVDPYGNVDLICG